MKTCSQCGELNGDNASNCFKCKARFGPQDNYKKICPRCKHIYSAKAENCDDCGSRLSVYSGESISKEDNSGCWMYIVAVLLPVVGIILGCIYIARAEDELGKSLILTSVITMVASSMIGFLFVGCTSFY